MRNFKVPTNAELAERAKSLDAHTVVRNWLARHSPESRNKDRISLEAWLDWAASNFLADPEIAQHLQPTLPLPAIHYESSLPSELDEFIEELSDRTDEIEGSCLNLGDGKERWVHTPDQVKAWITEAVGAWKSGEYAAPDVESEPVTLNPDFFTGAP